MTTSDWHHRCSAPAGGRGSTLAKYMGHVTATTHTRPVAFSHHQLKHISTAPDTTDCVPNIYRTFVLTNKFLGEIINDLDIGLMANFGQFVLKELVVRGGAGAGQRAEFVYLIF